MAPSRLAVVLMMALGLPAVASAGDTFLEKNGVVSIEAEHYTERTGPWYVVKGRNGALDRSQFSPAASGQGAVTVIGGAYTDYLRYAIYFTHPGVYQLWLLGSAGPRVDEVHVLFRPEAPSANGVTFGVTLPDDMGWSRHTHFVRVRQPGWYRLLIVRGKPFSRGPGQRPGWRVDNILLVRNAQEPPSGDGPEETTNSGQEPVPPQVKGVDHPLTDDVWEMRDGYLVIEAEPLRRSGWGVNDQPSGFTGAGYLFYYGCDDPAAETASSEIDETGTEQGPPDTWLVVRLKVPDAGRYRVNLKTFHPAENPNVECWIGRLDSNGLPEPPIRRSGDHLTDGPGFRWLNGEDVQAFDLKAGENTLYVAGFSKGFGIDRIAIYRDGDSAAEARALDPATRDNLPTE